jgi:hypothetical protein
MVWLYEKNGHSSKDTENDITIKVSMKETYGTIQKKMVWPDAGAYPNRGKRWQEIKKEKKCGREEREDQRIFVYHSI